MRNYTKCDLYVKLKNKYIEHEHFIWCSDLLLNRLKENDHLFIDGTYHVPKDFLQVIIIMCYDKIINMNIPCIYIALNSKTEEAYNLCFSFIKKLLLNNSEEKEFIIITTDNELALINSIKNNFKFKQRISCYYHFKNNIEKKAREIGLKKENYKDDTNKLLYFYLLINIKF